jgi:hypothetical protein
MPVWGRGQGQGEWKGARAGQGGGQGARALLIIMKSSPVAENEHYLPGLQSAVGVGARGLSERHLLVGRSLEHPHVPGKAAGPMEEKEGLLRFRHSGSTGGSLSPDGATLVSDTDREETFQTNQAFSAGVHFWEF